MDPDLALFVSYLQDANKKYFFCLLLFEGTFTSFFIDKKSHKKTSSFLFCLMMEGSGSVPLTNGSGPGPKSRGKGRELKEKRQVVL